MIKTEDKDKKIIDTFGKVVPELTEMDKEKLLAFGEGLAFAVRAKNKEAPDTDQDST